LSIDEQGSRTLRTGDIFRSDAEGYLYFVGRRDDIIKCRGQKVSPREVENVIGEMAGVAEVAVFGVPDELSGESVKAFVSLRPGSHYGADEIVAHCIERLESYMVPASVEIRSPLPKSENGKIDKTALASSVRAA
jgi:acyl-coenzyme A synthetase/AMP-(fatty) acid ligase